MDDTSRSVLYETLRSSSRDPARQAASTPKKLFLAHVALQKQCSKLIKYQEQQRYIEFAGLRIKIQEMERKRDRYRQEKQRIEEQRQRITRMLADLDQRRALFRSQREKTVNEISWLQTRDPTADLKTMFSLRSDDLGLQRIVKWRRRDKTVGLSNDDE